MINSSWQTVLTPPGAHRRPCGQLIVVRVCLKATRCESQALLINLIVWGVFPRPPMRIGGPNDDLDFERERDFRCMACQCFSPCPTAGYPCMLKILARIFSNPEDHKPEHPSTPEALNNYLDGHPKHMMSAKSQVCSVRPSHRRLRLPRSVDFLKCQLVFI